MPDGRFNKGIYMVMRTRLERLSLSWKLPILIAALLLVVIGTLSWAAYVEVDRSVRRSVADRLQAVAQPLVTQLADQMEANVEEVRDAAGAPELAACLRACAGGTQEAALSAIGAPGGSSGVAAELVDARGDRVLATDGAPEPAMLSLEELTVPARGAGGAAGRLRAVGDTLIYAAMAPVIEADSAVGYVVHWRALGGTAESRDRTARLLGADVYVGSMGPGAAWTDLAGPVPAPSFDIAGSTGAITYEGPGGRTRIATAAPIPGTSWHVVVATPESAALLPARRFLGRLGWIAGFFFLLAVPIAYAASRNITRPLRRLTNAAESFGPEGEPVTVPVDRRDELGILASAFNRMTERTRQSRRELEEKVTELRQTREQVVQAQRMEAVGRLAGGIAHDFNNVLTVITAESDLGLAELGPSDPGRASFLEIREAAARASALTRQLLSFSRRQVIEPAALDVNEVVTNLHTMLTRLLGEDIDLAVQLSPDSLVAEVDRGQLEQLTVNLAVNARDAMPGGGRLSLTTAGVELDEEYAEGREDVAPGEYVMVAVSDTGTGMSKETQTRLFEPFFTTKPHGKGTGLGLATCQVIMKEHGGHIAVYSERGVGTTVKAYFPRVRRAADAAAPAERTVVPGGSERVLLVEDETPVRNVARRILEKQGYQVLDAPTAEEALEILAEPATEIDLLLTDVVLPGMGGRDLVERAARLRPRMAVLFVSGYTDDIILHQRLTAGDAALLQKPFTAASLAKKVREVLDQSPRPSVPAGE